MPLTIRELEKEVHAKVPKDCMDEIIKSIDFDDLNLWGKLKPKHNKKHHIYVAVYKDLYHIGFEKLASKVKEFLKISKNSFCHNQKVLRKQLAKWGRSQIVLDDSAEWNDVKSDIDLPKSLADTNLVADSTDFPLKATKRISKKNADYSYKLGKYGQRFNSFMDLSGKIRYLSVGYSPKVHDSTFLKVNHQWIQENLQGGVCCADSHYSYGKHAFENIKFYIKRVPTIEVWNEEKQKHEKRLTEEDTKFNKDHSDVRSRVENPFAQIKNLFHSLIEPFEQGKTQLTYLVTFAVGVYNWKTTEKYFVEGTD